MTRMILIALPVAALLAGCQTVAEPVGESLGQATLHLSNGQSAGTARLLASGAEVSISIAVTDLSPGVHGAHLHTTGSCAATDFTSAGSHLNPGGKQHGSDNPAGAHLGDLPNVIVDDTGKGAVSTTLHGTRDEVLAQIFDADGTAVVVHAGPDDYRTDPSGNSGGRIACGVLTRT